MVKTSQIVCAWGPASPVSIWKQKIVSKSYLAWNKKKSLAVVEYVVNAIFEILFVLYIMFKFYLESNKV
jgi:hypothetical protein